MKPHDFWTKECWDISAHEGWVLTNSSPNDLGIEVSNICRITCPEDWEGLDYTYPKFKNDDEAVNFVIRKAANGSGIHMLAIWLEGHDLESECWVPRILTK